MRDITTQLDHVWEFQNAFNHPQVTEMVIGMQKSRELRLKLFKEELGELHQAMYNNDKVEILDAVLDGLYIVFGSIHYHGVGSVFSSFIDGERYDTNTPISSYPVEIQTILNTGNIQKKYLYGSITFSEVLMLHVELCSTLLSLYNKLELEGIFKKDSFSSAFLEVHESNMSKLENGKPKKRKDGKVLKGKDYFKPNLSQFVNL